MRISFRPSQPWNVKPPKSFEFKILPSDPPEPVESEETECTDEYVEGVCEDCKYFDRCAQILNNNRGMTFLDLIVCIFVIGLLVFWTIVLVTYGSRPVSEMPTWLYFLLSD